MKPGDLSLHLEAYLALKKALGFPLGARERLLRDFVAFAESNGVGVRGTISAQVAFDWACAVSDRCGISGKVARLSVARQFLFHLSAVVPDIEVPSATLLARPRRRKPFLFSTEEISRLLKAALSLRPQGSAMPSKRYEKKLVSFLTRPEIDAVLAAPDRNTRAGRRDHTFLLVAVQTGLRLSEMTGLRREDVALGTGAHVHCLGKGRKQRNTPLTKQAAIALKLWFQEPMRGDGQIVFSNARGTRLSPDGVQYLLAKHVAVARERCPALNEKRITPHCLRHTAAMELLHAGVDRSVIALWLGHESVETTQIYLDADLALKEQALAKTTPANVKHTGRYRPDDKLMAFLKGLWPETGLCRVDLRIDAAPRPSTKGWEQLRVVYPR
jgi:integrase